MPYFMPVPKIYVSCSAERFLFASPRPFHLPSLFYKVSRPIAPCCFLFGPHPFAFSAIRYHAIAQSKTGPYRTYGFLTDFANTTSRRTHSSFSAHLGSPSFARPRIARYICVIPHNLISRNLICVTEGR